MNNNLKQIISGGFVAAIMLMLILGCKFGSNSNLTVNNNSVANTNSLPVSDETVKTKNKYFWGGWIVQNNKKHTKTQFVFDDKKGILINLDYGNDEPPDNKLQKGDYEYIDRKTVKIKLNNKKTMTATLSPEGDVMTVDNYNGESLTLKKNTNQMQYYVCYAKPQSCGYPYSD